LRSPTRPSAATSPARKFSSHKRAAELVSLANAHERAERLNEAEEALHQALAVVPGHAGALHLLGIVSFKQGWVEKAALLIEQSIGASRDTALYHRNICEVYRTLGRYDDALAAGRRAAALAPDRRARPST
jgi:tetratricopeptide (TPR) repeat protein